jgi:AI-2 transport protein TqsA
MQRSALNCGVGPLRAGARGELARPFLNGLNAAARTAAMPFDSTPPQSPDPTHAIRIGAGIVIVMAGVHLGAALLVPMTVAFLLITATAPVTAYCVRRGFSPALAAGAGVLLNLLLIAALATLLGFASLELQHDMARYVARTSEGLAALQRFLVSHHLPADRTTDSLNELSRSVVQQGLFGAASSIEVFGVILLLLFFGLAESASIGVKLRRIFPNTRHDFPEIDRLVREVQSYLLVKLFTSSLAALIAWVILHFAHIGLALPLALVMFVLHFIPNVGPLLAMGPALAVAFVDRGGGGMLAVAIGYLATTLSIGNLLEPRILGRTLGLSPLAVVLALFLWGPIGALLAVPLTSVLKLVLESSAYARWGLLLEDPAHLSDVDEPEPEPAKVRRLSKLPWRYGTGSPLGLGSGGTPRPIAEPRKP